MGDGAHADAKPPRAVLSQREGVWNEALKERLATLAGRTLCVAGLGAIGEQCALIGKAFGMRVIGIRRRAAPSARRMRWSVPSDGARSLPRRASSCSILPDTRETRASSGREELSVMKGAFLLNGGPGP